MLQKFLQCCTVQHLDVKMIQRGIELPFLFPLEKQTVVNSQLWAGWLEAYASGLKKIMIFIFFLILKLDFFGFKSDLFDFLDLFD